MILRSLYIYIYQRNAPANSSKRGSLRLALIMAGLNARGLQSKLLITPLSE